jgi:FlaA1/EpsC-like NDP-sugar epimerase
VDHLSQGIEEQWLADETLPFEEALNMEFKKFGICGFLDVVEEKTKSMRKRYYRLVMRYVKEFFSLPKIVATMLLTLVIFTLLSFIPISYRLYFIAAFIFGHLAVVITLMYKNKKHRKKHKSTQNSSASFLLEDMIYGYGLNGAMFAFIFQIPQLIFQSDTYILDTPLKIAVLSVLITLYSVLSYVIFKVLPNKANQFLIEEYKGYSIRIIQK